MDGTSLGISYSTLQKNLEAFHVHANIVSLCKILRKNEGEERIHVSNRLNSKKNSKRTKNEGKV